MCGDQDFKALSKLVLQGARQAEAALQVHRHAEAEIETEFLCRRVFIAFDAVRFHTVFQYVGAGQEGARGIVRSDAVGKSLEIDLALPVDQRAEADLHTVILAELDGVFHLML